MRIERENFIEHDARGGIAAVYCKLCGTKIAGAGIRKVQDERGEIREVEAFVRTPLYMEIEILFDDNSRHVTHICKTCNARNIPPALLMEMFKTDMKEQGVKGLGRIRKKVTRRGRTALRGEGIA